MHGAVFTFPYLDSLCTAVACRSRFDARCLKSASKRTSVSVLRAKCGHSHQATRPVWRHYTLSAFNIAGAKHCNTPSPIRGLFHAWPGRLFSSVLSTARRTVGSLETFQQGNII
eukprot:1309470-Amorphochlora_amoeboformis.AAC.1